MSNVITPILFFLVAIGLFFTYLSPAFDVLQAFQAQELRLDNTLRDSGALLEAHNTLLLNYNSIPSDDLKRLNKILPNDVDVVRLIMDIDALTTKHRLTVKSFEVPQIEGGTNAKNTKTTKNTPVVDEGPVGSAILTIECAGDYSNFKKLLLDIEKSLSLMDVVSLEVEVADLSKPGATEGIVYKLGLQTYWLK